jgi:sec-independent protein translocase protein TatA
MPGSIGPMELVVVLVIALIVLGPKKLPEVGRSIGRGMREFKDSIAGDDRDRDYRDDDDGELPGLEPPRPRPTPDAEAETERPKAGVGADEHSGR